MLKIGRMLRIKKIGKCRHDMYSSYGNKRTFFVTIIQQYWIPFPINHFSSIVKSYFQVAEVFAESVFLYNQNLSSTVLCNLCWVFTSRNFIRRWSTCDNSLSIIFPNWREKFTATSLISPNIWKIFFCSFSPFLTFCLSVS